ncbi:MAG: hypothetical protein U9Q88_14390 [Bacillota bacterium]|nr:hypothetical protein [Bacillota bacterium]
MNLLANYIKRALYRRNLLYQENIEYIDDDCSRFVVPFTISYGGPSYFEEKEIYVHLYVDDKYSLVDMYITEYIFLKNAMGDFRKSLLLEQMNTINMENSLCRFYIDDGWVLVKQSFDFIATENLEYSANNIISTIFNNISFYIADKAIIFEDLVDY